LTSSRYAQKFHQGCAKLGYNSFPTPQAALSRPYNGRPATVISAFAQQHADPTGTRSSAPNVFVPDAVATGRLDLRPNSYVSEITVDEQSRAKGAVYNDEEGTTYEQEADALAATAHLIGGFTNKTLRPLVAELLDQPYSRAAAATTCGGCA
jgi:choline dehydrogenase-like flavoprotein